MRLAVAFLLLAITLPFAHAQSGACDEARVSPDTLRIGVQGGTRYVDLTGPAGCTYVASSPQAWMSPTASQFTSTGGATSIGVAIQANADDAQRSGYFEIATLDGVPTAGVYVEQFGGCDIRLARKSFSFPIEGGQGFIEATTESPECASGVAFASGYDWIQLDHVGGFTVLPNDGYERQGAISVGMRSGSATEYVQVYQTGPLTYGAPTHSPTGEGDWATDLEAPGPGAALAAVAVLGALLLRRRSR